MITQPTATLLPGTSNDLIVEATLAASGFFQCTVTVNSNDPDTPAFSGIVAGYAQSPGSSGGKETNDNCSTGTGHGFAWLALLGLAAVLGARLQ